MASWRMWAVIALTGLSVAVGTAAGAEHVGLYDVTATEACLAGLPGAVAGLPPATPPIPAPLFVYRYPRTHFLPTMTGRLGAWSRPGRTGAYEEVSISFFKNVRDARRSPGAAAGRVRNAVFESDPGSAARTKWGKAARACLRTAGGAAPPVQPVPRASLATFVGYWGGHTRGLRIASAGRAREFVDDGCCRRVYDMTFQILRVTGTLTRASAVYRVTTFRHYPGGPRLRIGQTGSLALRNGIVTNKLTQDYFCSDVAWAATGACGA